MRIGDRIVRKSNLEGGYIHAARKTPSGVYMVWVGWDLTGAFEWLPSEEIRPWDKLNEPPPAGKTSWGRTTPDYLVKLRTGLRRNRENNPAKERRIAEKKLADDLLKLSAQHKNRSKMKAQKMIAKFHRQG